MSSGKEEGNFSLIKITGWFVRYLAGLWVKWLVFWWFVGSMVSLWLMFGFGLFVDGLVGLWVVWMVCVYLCVCVCVGGADSGGVLVSKRSILSYQQYIIFVSKQELF